LGGDRAPRNLNVSKTTQKNKKSCEANEIQENVEKREEESHFFAYKGNKQGDSAKL
jgi:hypothetical protein